MTNPDERQEFLRYVGSKPFDEVTSMEWQKVLIIAMSAVDFQRTVEAYRVRVDALDHENALLRENLEALAASQGKAAEPMLRAAGYLPKKADT